MEFAYVECILFSCRVMVIVSDSDPCGCVPCYAGDVSPTLLILFVFRSGFAISASCALKCTFSDYTHFYIITLIDISCYSLHRRSQQSSYVIFWATPQELIQPFDCHNQRAVILYLYRQQRMTCRKISNRTCLMLCTAEPRQTHTHISRFV